MIGLKTADQNHRVSQTSLAVSRYGCPMQQPLVAVYTHINIVFQHKIRKPLIIKPFMNERKNCFLNLKDAME